MTVPTFTPSSLIGVSDALEAAMIESRNVTFDSVLMLCEDIASFDGTAADCFTAIAAFRRRLEESRQ